MPLTIEQRAEMRRVAEAATPGPWEVEGEAIPFHPKQRNEFADQGAGISFAKGKGEIVVGGAQDEQGGAVGILSNEDAAHIATFNPATALSLLDQLADREREVAELREALSRHLSPAACDYHGGTHCITHGDARPCRHEVTRGLLEGGR